ncbi:cation transporter [Lujinxingia litoralis]|uniref:Cation transporter n=1 Tax=Lujinxingia litoralis TaxID=2211119 RepID=A0A328C5E4_9DELT|nr:cation diffusion facilitator family transporter [Lujinxingia litoralis]RAL21132.1 cation transporter [Lujinxingia litoralis]
MSAHAHHSHDSHDHHHHGPTPEHALKVAIALNASFLILEVVVGLWTNSLALLSDAGHMISDVGALIVALVAMRIATRRPSSGFTFGLRRAPVLGGLLNAASLVVIVVMITIEAVGRFQHPPPLEATAVLWTGVAGLIVNLGSAWYLARSRDESVNTRGAMLHLLSDALGSVAAIVSAVAVMVWGLNLADPIASLVIAALILVGSWPLLRDTVAILLQRAPANIDIEALLELLLADPRVEDVIDLHVWDLDAGQPVLSGVLTVNTTTLKETNALSDELRLQIKERFGVTHATLECRDLHAGVFEPEC